MDTAGLEGLKRSVHQLADSVEQWRRGAIDEQTVRQIAKEVMGQSGRPRRSYRPGLDEGDGSHVVPEAIAAQGRERVDQVQTMAPGQVADALRLPEDRVRRFQETTDRLLLLAAARGQAPEETPFYRDRYLPMVQAMDTATSAEGTEYVPRELSGSLIERVNLELRVAALFETIEMPTNPFDIPALAVTRTRLGKASEQTGDSGQTGFLKITPGTRKVTLTAAKFAGEVIVSRELEEDALVATLPFVEQELVDYLAADVEDTTINGDTSGSHQDSDVTASTDPRKNWTGLRKSALAAAKTDASNAVLTSAMLRANRKKMGKYGIRPDQLAHVVSMGSYINLLADTNLQTVDKFGPNATLLSGELAKVDGVPLIVSEYVRSDLNASGVYDGTTTNRSIALTVNRRGFLFGNRRGITIQLLRELYAEYDQDAIICTLRRAFSARFPTASETVVALTYNLA